MGDDVRILVASAMLRPNTRLKLATPCIEGRIPMCEHSSADGTCN